MINSSTAAQDCETVNIAANGSFEISGKQMKQPAVKYGTAMFPPQRLRREYLVFSPRINDGKVIWAVGKGPLWADQLL